VVNLNILIILLYQELFLVRFSAYWIALKAIKFIIDVSDNFITIENKNLNEQYEEIKEIIYEHFKVFI